MRNGRKNRNSKAWSALERKKKKKKRKNPGEVSDGHESALDAFFWDSDCSETSGVDRDRLRNEPIHPPRPRECSSNRPSTTLESGNLIIHIESMRGIKTQRFCGEEFGFLIFMDEVSFFLRFLEKDSSLKDDFDLCRSKKLARIRRSIDSKRIKKNGETILGMVLISVKEGMKGEKLLRILLNTMRECIKMIRLRKSRSLRTFRVEKNLLSKGNVYKKFLRYLLL